MPAFANEHTESFRRAKGIFDVLWDKTRKTGDPSAGLMLYGGGWKSGRSAKKANGAAGFSL